MFVFNYYYADITFGAVARMASSTTADIPCITIWDSDDDLPNQSSSGMRGGRERPQEPQNDESSDSSITVLLNLGSPTTNEIESDSDKLLDLRDDESNGSSDTILLDLQDSSPAANENGETAIDYRRLRTQYPRYNQTQEVTGPANCTSINNNHLSFMLSLTTIMLSLVWYWCLTFIL